MRPSEPEREETTGPGAAAKKAALGVIDACLEFFQRQHNRLAGIEAREDRHGRSPEKHEAATEAAVPARPSLLRRLAIGLLLLLAGLAAGGYLAYRSFSVRLQGHNEVVERMLEEVDAVRKEDARNIKLLDKFQRESAEYRHEAREAQRETESANRRVAELEAELEAMKSAEAKKRAEEAARAARRTAEIAKQRTARQRTPQKSGNCAAGTAAEMAECIEKFNRP